jgi:hypothetical protein
MGLFGWWPLVWRSTFRARESRCLQAMHDADAASAEAMRQRDDAQRQAAEARRQEVSAADRQHRAEAALEATLREHATFMRETTDRYVALEEKFVQAMTERDEARAECERWAESVRNGAGAPDLQVPARPRRKPAAGERSRRRKKGEG